MRVTFISIILIICIILAAHGAPLDSRSPRAKALKIGAAKKTSLKAPKAKATIPVKFKTAKPVKVKTKPVKAKPAAKAKTTKVTSKAKTTKPAAKKKTKVVANTKKAAPKAKAATIGKPTAVKVKSSTKAIKSKTEAIKPAVKTPAKTKATKAKATKAKAPASKVKSTKATKAKAPKAGVTKANGTKPEAKGAKKTSAKDKTTAAAKTKPAAKTKKPASAKACATKKSKTAGKTTKKARVNTPPPDDGCEEFDICPEFDDCNTCVGVDAGCGFDFKTNKCVKVVGSAINPLAKNKQQCTSLANSQAEASTSSDDAIIEAAALKFFNPKIASHIFVGEKTSKRSGRHILSIWTKDNKDSTVSDDANLGTTGIVRFAIPSSKKTKTVWNDVAGNGARVYSQAQIRDICISALSASIKANPGNEAALAGAGAADTGAASKSKKGKGKATAAPALKLLGGLDNAFVTPSPVGNLCVNVNEASCFPVSLKTVSGAIGSPCTGDDNEEGA